MNRPHLKERDAVYEDLHGVKNIIEHESFVEGCLFRLEKEIKASSNAQAYNKAMFLNKRYVKDAKFQLMFLRADEYDPIKAACQLILHFEKKLFLFGYEKLPKHIRWDVLDSNAITSLQTGLTYCYPSCKDSTCRVVYSTLYPVKSPNASELYHVRAGWYQIMSTLLPDEETQHKGFQKILYMIGASLQDILDKCKAQQENLWVSAALLFRLSALHFCTNNECIGPILSMTMGFAPAAMVTRTRLHYGSHMECQI